MDLIAEVTQKNDQLLLQHAKLLEYFCTRINTPKFGSFLITFTVAPFIVGAVIQLGLGANGLISRQLRTVTLSGLRFLPPF